MIPANRSTGSFPAVDRLNHDSRLDLFSSNRWIGCIISDIKIKNGFIFQYNVSNFICKISHMYHHSTRWEVNKLSSL